MSSIWFFLALFVLAFGDPHYGTDACKGSISYALGNRVPVLFLVEDSEYTLPFYPAVDEYSMMHFYEAGAHALFYKNPSTSFYLELQGGVNGTTTSDPISFSDDEYFLPYVTLVINLFEGKPLSIVIDRPLPDRVPYGEKDCTSSQCDPIVYLAWAGTDVNGLRCHSVDSIFSRLRAFSVKSMIDTSMDFYGDVKDSVKDLVDDVRSHISKSVKFL
ncbi:hypothetical protein GEMRC1_002458 [Eukaryota sp. GEM-RC1]